MENVVEEDNIDKLSDNRDFDVMDSWENLEGTGVYEGIVAHHKASRLAWLQFRSLQVHVFSAYHENDVPAVEQLLAKVTAAYKAGVATINPKEGCYTNGYHLPRQNMFRAYRKVYNDAAPVFVGALTAAAQISKLHSAPARGHELETRIQVCQPMPACCDLRLCQQVETCTGVSLCK